MWKCHWKRLKWDWIKVLRELSLRQSILPDPNIMNPILLINVTYRCWSGPQQRKKTNTNTVDIRTPRRHNVKKNCVAIINPEKKKHHHCLFRKPRCYDEYDDVIQAGFGCGDIVPASFRWCALRWLALSNIGFKCSCTKIAFHDALFT